MNFKSKPLPAPRTVITDTNGIITEPWQRGFAQLETNQDALRYVFFGSGDPNTVRVAPTGSVYFNLSGGAGATFWVKESSPTPSTGWVAK